jgi:hypothetical protein
MRTVLVRLDDSDHELVRLLSFVTKEPIPQIIVRLLHEEFDRKLPGKRAGRPTPRADLLEALGLPPLAPDAAADAWVRQVAEHYRAWDTAAEDRDDMAAWDEADRAGLTRGTTDNP